MVLPSWSKWILFIAIITVFPIGWWIHESYSASSELKLYGNVDIRQVSLAFENSERLAEVLVEEGDTVKKGQVLARLESKTLELQIKQAEAQVASAEADLELANVNLNRLQRLSAETSGKGVSIQDLDNVKAIVKVAEAKVSGNKAQLDVLNHQLELSELRAPQDGVIRARLLEVGDMASSAKPVFTIAITNPKWVRVYVKETDLGFLKEGLSAAISIDSYPDKKIPGTVGYISSVAEFTPKSVQTEELRTNLVYEVRVNVKDPDNVLRLGMPATVLINLIDTAEK